MSDIREAAERLRQMRADSDDHDGGYLDTPEGQRQSLHDHVCLADAYLAEHPTDDDEPISDEWLMETYGFDRCNNDQDLGGTFSLVAYEHCEWEIRSYVYAVYDGHDHSHDLGKPKTRGHVRRLCAALGIEPKT